MRIEIMPRNLSGRISAIASKSHAHRLMIAAALAGGGTAVDTGSGSRDIKATEDCLAQLSGDIPVLNCGESGSTLRFLVPVTMALKDEAVFIGEGRLPHRPLAPLDAQMEEHGCTFIRTAPEGEASQEICRIRGRLHGGAFTLPGNISSQYITGLLFALPLLKEDSTITITTPQESGKYVDMTLDVLGRFGIRVSVRWNDGCPVYEIPGNQKYTAPAKVTAEGDWSNIAFWFVAGLLSEGSGLTCTGLDPDSLQGDKEIASLVEKMGAAVSHSGDSVSIMKNRLQAIDIDAAEIPDLVPVLAVAAATAEGTTRIYNAGRLRIKESDRLAAMYDCLCRAGADITEEPDGLTIHGVDALKGCTVSGYNDHRIVMAMAIAAIVAQGPVIIDGAEAVNKSYPGFFEDLRALGGEFRVI